MVLTCVLEQFLYTHHPSQCYLPMYLRTYVLPSQCYHSATCVHIYFHHSAITVLPMYIPTSITVLSVLPMYVPNLLPSQCYHSVTYVHTYFHHSAITVLRTYLTYFHHSATYVHTYFHHSAITVLPMYVPNLLPSQCYHSATYVPNLLVLMHIINSYDGGSPLDVYVCMYVCCI